MKTLKVITIVLAIVVISAISFFGVFTFTNNTFKNSIKDYLLGMELKGARHLKLEEKKETEMVIYDKDGNKVVQEEGVEYTEENGYKTVEETIDNSTKGDYKASKLIIEKRLKKLGVTEYVVKQDTETGIITVQLPENENTDYIASILGQVGNFEMIDAETKEVLMDNNDFKEASILYNTTETGTTVYLSMEFNNEGTKKLEEISKTYIKTTVPKEDSIEENKSEEENTEKAEENEEDTTENNIEEDSTETIEKKVTINIDGQEYLTTYFSETISTGQLTISTGTSSEPKVLQEYILNTTGISVFLNDRLPLAYEITESETLTPTIEKEEIMIIIYVAIAIIALIFIYAVIKYKTKGIISGILELGYIAILLLIIRYTNISLTISGIVATIFISLFNYILLLEIINKTVKEEKSFNSEFKKVSIKIIPILIISIVLSFSDELSISSFGMILFWGLIVYTLYNLTISKLICEK